MAKKSPRGIVLVIEDEADIRRFVCRVLALEGFAVIEADNGGRGLELTRQHKCILVLVDLRLPYRDGWSVLEEMKRDEQLRDIPVIILTASAGVSQREKALQMGAADYLIKPLSVAELRDGVARALVPLSK